VTMMNDIMRIYAENVSIVWVLGYYSGIFRSRYAMICDVCIVHNMFDIEMLDYVICV